MTWQRLLIHQSSRAQTFRMEVNLCNPVRAIKKLFKKVVKNAKYIIPALVVAGAAIYFGAGALTGGGAGISGLAGSLGLGSTLSSVLTGAVTQAGIGAAIGAGTSLVTGGDVGKGALIGGAAGAVTGGITGAVNAPTTDASSFGRDPQFPQASNLGSGGANPGPAGSLDAAASVNPATSILPPQTGSPDSNGLLSGVGKFITDNQTLLGGAIQGIGAGIGGLAEADARVEAAQLLADQDEAARAQIASNFDVSGGVGLLSGGTLDTTPRPTPTQQFTRPSVQARARGARWQYNPATGQVELTQAA